MKKKHVSLVALMVLSFNLFSFCAFLAYGIWTMNLPPNWGKPFPEDTQIIQHTDTHRGVFRRSGIAVIVAQIPEPYIQAFGNKLRNEEFLPGHLVGESLEVLCTVEAAGDILDSPHTLYRFDDGAIAFVEEPCSDWEAAVYDLESGLFCCIEYDE